MIKSEVEKIEIRKIWSQPPYLVMSNEFLYFLISQFLISALGGFDEA